MSIETDVPTEEIQTQIREGHYGDNVSELLPIDPSEPTRMTLSLDQIREYDHNPRREPNPRFEEIKEVIRSMRERGEPIRMTVTRRPEERDKPCMVHAGGNSFLKALQEIYKETQDPFLNEIDCLFVPWRSESEEIIAHLIENDVRGDLVFIDRALSVMELRKEIEQDLGEEVSQRRLAEILAQRGYRVGGQPAISRMEYAVNTLLPCIPLALAGGLGKDGVAEIRKYEKALRESIEYMGMGDRMDAAHQIWLDSLVQFDSYDEWEFEYARRHVLSRLEELTGEDSQMICARIDAALEGGVPGVIGSLESEPLIQRRPRRSRKQDPEPSVEASGNTTSQASPDGVTPLANEPPSAPPQPETPMPAAATLSPGPSPAPESTALSGIQGPESAGADTPRTSQKDLRARMWTLATQIAGRNGLDECVLHIGHAGGYVMDMPSSSLRLDQDSDRALQRMSLWWFLGSLVDQWALFDEIETMNDVVGLLPEDSGVYAIVSAYLDDSDAHQARRDQATETLVQVVGDPSWITAPKVSRWLFVEFDEPDLQTLIELISTRRELAQICREQHKRYLWEL